MVDRGRIIPIFKAMWENAKMKRGAKDSNIAFPTKQDRP